MNTCPATRLLRDKAGLLNDVCVCVCLVSYYLLYDVPKWLDGEVCFMLVSIVRREVGKSEQCELVLFL